MTRFTERSVEQLQADGARREIPDALLPGLYLVLQPSGAKSWALRYRHEGRPRKFTIGSHPRIKLAAARELGRLAFQAIAEGRDPANERREARRKDKAGIVDSDLFATIFENYRKRHLSQLRPSTRNGIEALFQRELLPAWGRRRLTEIRRADVLELLDGIMDRGVPGQANHVYAVLKAFLAWCVERGHLTLAPTYGLKRPAPQASRDRVLSDQEVRWLWAACTEIGPPFGAIAKLLVLTATRREEARSLVDSELNIRERVWVLPAERTKNGVLHAIHLAQPTLDILAAIPRIQSDRGYLFTTNGRTAPSGFGRAKRNIDALMLAAAKAEAEKRGEDPDAVKIAAWTFHDLRRSFASGLAALGINLPTIERCLNHISGSFGGVAGIYQRYSFDKEKVAAFETWAAHVESVVNGAPARIVPLRRAT